MADNDLKRIDPKKLSKKSQEKLEEIRKNQNLKTIAEAYDFLVRNFVNESLDDNKK